MTADQFWKIIDETCRDPLAAEDWDERLTDALSRLPTEEIVEWDRMFHRLGDAACRVDLWAAAYLINGGASDDGFYYFRCWLIGMGREVYDAAIADPDSLAATWNPEWELEGVDPQAETYAAAWTAWMRVSGQPDTAPYPARSESAEPELTGEDWDFEDEDLMRQHLPRLSALLEGRYDE